MAPPAAPPAPGLDVAALATTLLGIVAEKTGYPVEMLNPEMELEADLGIDSIKRVEILAALRAAAPNLPEVDPRELASLRTISAIMAKLHGGAPAAAAPAPLGFPIARIGLAEADAPAGQGQPALWPQMTVVIAGEGAGLAQPLAEALQQAGLVVLPRAEAARAQALVALHALDAAPTPELVAQRHLDAFASARDFAAGQARSQGSFITVQDTGGDFGLSGQAGRGAWLGGVAGIAKTAAAEWPGVQVRVIDLERASQASGQLARRLATELLAGSADQEVGLRADGRRSVLVEQALAEVAGPAPALPEGAVLVVSGGARGIVPGCLLALAPRLRPRLLLLGRTPLVPEPEGLAGARTQAELSRAFYEQAQREGRAVAPRQLAAQAASVLALREVRANIAALEAAGATVRYSAVDVTDSAALAAVLAAARAEWGGIHGLVHGAGVLADKLIANQTDDEFLRVFRTKVDGLRALLEATAGDALSRLCLFSSVAGRYGNVGQAAYAAANEVLNKVARTEAARRGGACRVLALNWGPWDGGMVTDSLRQAFAERGVPLIAARDGADAFVAEMLAADGGGAMPVEIVLGGRIVAPAMPVLATAT
jgi:NADP-dependent 3-hydroxy acid dehydrogenase YdfG/acyl carrier protein